jgi:hypothetical protein
MAAMALQLIAQAVTYNYHASSSLGIVPILLGLVFGFIGLAVGIYCLWLLYQDVLAIPPEHRQQNFEPTQVWFLLIPIFGLVWDFILFPRIADSFRAHFEATGRPEQGDYGRQLGLIASISACCCVVPCVNFLAGPATLVLWILLLVKFNGYKKLIETGGGGGFPGQPVPPL